MTSKKNRNINGDRKNPSRSTKGEFNANAHARRLISGWTKKLVLFLGILSILGLLGLVTAIGFTVQSLPSYFQLKETENDQSIRVRASDGTLLVELGPSYGEWLDYDEIPQAMKNAMIAVEDRRYFFHFGIDPIRLTGAILESLFSDRRIGGTSTISQQLARNLFLNNNRSLDRKVREAIIAFALEWKFSKEQILELYLNKVYFGGGAYGIDSASRNFFSHPAKSLSVAEASIIAGLVKAPSRYAPTADVGAAVARAQTVLRLMRDQGYITAQEAAVDVNAVNLKVRSNQNSVRYFTDYVLPQLDLLLPETFEAIEVWTTLDIDLQEEATKAITRHTPEGVQGALLSLDSDGAILAMVGGVDYVESNYNRATKALRQPGSAWKLFVYLAALEAGYLPEDRVIDAPFDIDGYSPNNHDGEFVGEVDLRTAFAASINTVAVKLGQNVGFEAVASMAKRFGITSDVLTFPSMALGTSEVRLIDMTRAFASVSEGGQSVETYGIKRVTTAKGEEIFKYEAPVPRQLVSNYVAAGITDLLQTAVSFGTGRAAQIGRPVAGKTGTTSSNKDGYFVGFSSGITTGVWIGRDDARAVSGLAGGRAPASAFSEYMRLAVEGRPVESFETDAKFPNWLFEPDEEFLYEQTDDYFLIDEYGDLIAPQELRDGEGLPSIPSQDQNDQEGRSSSLRVPSNEEDRQLVGDDFLDQPTRRRRSFSDQFELEENR